MSYTKIIPYINAENEPLDTVLQLAKEYSYGEQMSYLYIILLKKMNIRKSF